MLRPYKGDLRRDSGAAGIGVALEALQVRAEVGGVVVATVAVCFERIVDDVFEAGRQVWIQTHRRQRRLVKNGIEHGRGGFSAKGKLSGGHLVKHDTEREEISTGIQILAEGLFGGHVGNGAKRGARTGEVLVRRLNRSQGSVEMGQRSFVSGLLSEAEVEDFGVAAPGDENIGGGDVTGD